MVLPCLDEAAALPWVLKRIPPGYRAIVADNGSRDDSPRIAADLGANVVHVAQRGFGAAAHAGLLAATAEVVCFVDADGSLDPGARPAAARGPSTPASATPSCHGGCAGRLVSGCAISARCGRPGATP